MKLEIWQDKISKDRIDSFWYEGVVANIGNYLLIACGDIRIAFPEDNFEEWYKYHHAVEEAYNRGYKDKDLQKVEWGNNNWFEVVKGYEDENGMLHIQDDIMLDVTYDYDSGIKKLKIYAEEEVFGKVKEIRNEK